MKIITISEIKQKGHYYIVLDFLFDKKLHNILMNLGCSYDSKNQNYRIINTASNYYKIINELSGEYSLDTNKLRKSYLERTINKTPLRTIMELNKEANILFRKFERYMVSKRYSEQTIKSYLVAIKQFLGYFSDRDPLEIGNEEVNDYVFNYIIPKGYSISVQRQLVSAIKLFYGYVSSRKMNIDKLETPRKEFSLPKLLSTEEIRKMIEVSVNLKHKTILMVLYGTGIRMAELLHLQISDINSKQGVIHIRKGKGNKDRNVQLNEILLKQLRAYFIAYRPKVYLFEGQGGNKYSSSSVNNTLQQAARRAGINKRVSAHMIRHSYATHMLDKGISIRHIQVLLGHKSSTTTEIYTHVSTQGIKDIGNPLDDFSIFVGEQNNKYTKT